ncbi:MAG: hypothetical protein F6K41_01915 [Symploca sp. SIO3E6]|nr:hypothetical protein [Caldora sp. SIO3E6]
MQSKCYALERRFSNHKIERAEEQGSRGAEERRSGGAGEQGSRGELKVLIFRFSICQLLLVNRCSRTPIH